MKHTTRPLLAALAAACIVATATASPVGVTVNGDMLDSAGSSGEGWAYVSPTLTLSGAGPFMLSGTNMANAVCVVVSENVTNTVTLSNLMLYARSSGQCAFALGANADVSLFLAGTNRLASGAGRAGIEVAAGRSLSITNAPGDDAGALLVTGGSRGAGIGGGDQAACGLVTFRGGMVTATSGYRSAGVGGGGTSSSGSFGGSGGTVRITGGTLVATATDNGAGIGGGYRSAGGTVEISGGTVTATSSQYAGGAGIGGGGSTTSYSGGSGGTITISGGRVTATGGGSGGAGIGGGFKGAGGTIEISGGMVTAAGGAGAPDVGHGLYRQPTTETTRFTGGTIRSGGVSPSPIPRNNTDEPVACAVVAGFEPDAPVVFASSGSGLPDYYGTNDIFADDGGCIHLWLPEGDYVLTANGRTCTAKVEDGVGSSGVTVNGEDVAFDSLVQNPGWTYTSSTRTLALDGAGPFTLSGGNVVGGVCVVVPDGTVNTMTLSNLTLRATGSDQCAFALETNACVSLFLAGTNTLFSGLNRAGIEVAAGRSLSITNAPGDGAGALSVTGGSYGAGIGGGNRAAGGTVEILGGTVTAVGGKRSAGIGGGGTKETNYDGGAGGTVRIGGGTLVATGNEHGAGIGGGYSSTGGTVEISGGMVTATGGHNGGAGIGGGWDGAGGTIGISGGTVFAQSNGGGTDIGPGKYGAASGSNTFTGGSIRLANGTISPAPSNGTVRVWCVTVPWLDPGAPVMIALPGTYGVNDLFADENGKLYLWLPNGGYTFIANGVTYVATVSDADVTATMGHFHIAAFVLADDTAALTLASQLDPDAFATWIATMTLEVQFCTNLMEAAWTPLPGTALDGMTLTVPFTATNTPRAFLRVLAQ
ncbi:MAG: hypothetical protein ACOX5G_06995 [Kiritimatiellia bacterium]|jgi:hypothetical protein